VISVYRYLLSSKSPANIIFEHNADFAELNKYINLTKIMCILSKVRALIGFASAISQSPMRSFFNFIRKPFAMVKGTGVVVEAVEKLKHKNIEKYNIICCRYS
jgi:hypothetical protein